jgi:maleate isomerase
MDGVIKQHNDTSLSGGVGGWRTRIGLITPDDGINDDEYWQYLPPGVALIFTRYRTKKRFEPISPSMVDSYADLEPILDAAETLRITRPKAIVFLCNSCSFVRGVGSDLKIAEAIHQAVGIPAITISTAQIQALRALGVKRVAVGAPYPPPVTELLVKFLEGNGFSVTGTKSLGLKTEWQIGNSPPSVWYDVALEVNSPEAECVLLACSGIRTAAIMTCLESDLGKPVVSAPAVSIWAALRLAGVKSPLSGRGALFERY